MTKGSTLFYSNLKLVQNFENKAALVQCGCINKGRKHYNGYSVLCFNAQESKGTIYLRSYFDDRSAFDKAVNKCPEGKFSIDMKRKDDGVNNSQRERSDTKDKEGVVENETGELNVKHLSRILKENLERPWETSDKEHSLQGSKKKQIVNNKDCQIDKQVIIEKVDGNVNM